LDVNPKSTAGFLSFSRVLSFARHHNIFFFFFNNHPENFLLRNKPRPQTSQQQKSVFTSKNPAAGASQELRKIKAQSRTKP
jgi:hypothetical protein